MGDLYYAPSSRAPRHGVIFLHGLGANNFDLVSTTAQIISALDGKQSPDLQDAIDACRFPLVCVLPQAPVLPLTIGAGMPVPAWFDIYSLERGAKEDHSGLSTARSLISALAQTLEREHQIAQDQIFLGGFSQGGIVALSCLCHEPQRYAGIFAVSSCLAREECLPSGTAEMATPVLVAHGGLDEVIPVKYGFESYERLQRAGFQVEWAEQPHTRHAIDDKTVVDIVRWLKPKLAN